PDDEIKPASQVIHILAQCVGGDGNLLLDVGPMPDGRIEPRQVAVLQQVGAWLDKNGESIYGTRGGPWKPTQSIASTRKGNSIFLHILRPDDGLIELPALPGHIKSAALLGGGKVEFTQNNGKLNITVPKASFDAIDTIVRLELDGPALDLPVLSFAPAIKARASNTYQNDDQYDPQQAFDHDPATRWATDSGTKQAWISADLGQTKTIVGVRIQEAAPNAGRVQKFEFQYRDGGDWKTIFTGEKIGARFEKKFDAVTAQEFRLNILDATEGPTLSEIELLEK
ncbi:MAG: discoidin domain-containing protein, partial [Limisphaerales bacterium]